MPLGWRSRGAVTASRRGQCGRMRRKFLIGLIAVAIASTALAALPSSAAKADPVPNQFAQWAINVPGSVLAAAAPTSGQAAILASGQRFDWRLASPAFSAVAGLATATPAAPASALTATDLALWNSATTSFAAPATKALPLARAGAPALLSFSVGTLIGSSGARVFGFHDNLVCQERNAALTFAASILDGVDCSAYESALEELQQNLDQQIMQVPTQQCYLTICMSYLGQAPYINGTSKQLCFGITGTYPSNVSTLTGGVLMDSGAASQITTGDPGSGCYGTYSSVTPMIRSAWAYSVNDTIDQWRFYARKNGQTVYTSAWRVYSDEEQYRSNPTRWWRCDVRDTTGVTHSATSNAFTEQDETFAPLICPTLPNGTVPNRITIYELTATTQSLVYQQDLTTAYSNWKGAFPECTNGSCFLDLRQDSESCFYGGTIVCNGWFADPARDSTYSCFYGTHSVALSECFVYANAFDPALIKLGQAYVDPVTGIGSGLQSSPTLKDEIVSELMERDWLGDATPIYSYDVLQDKAIKAREIAEACVDMSILPGLDDLGDRCKVMPIFAPGADVRSAAEHDYDAIVGWGSTSGNPDWIQLSYMSVPEKQLATGLRRDWYQTDPRCAPYYPTGPYIACDEYPYFTSAEGGTAASLRMVDSAHNSREGGLLWGFVSVCGIADAPLGSEGREYLVVPIVTLGIQSSAVCEPTS